MPTPTAGEISRLRRQLGLTETQLPDAEINEMYTEAGTLYPEGAYSRNVWFAFVRLQAAKDLMAEAAQRVTYAQGQSRENLSDLLGNLEKLVALYQRDLASVLADENPSVPGVMWGRMRTVPSVIMESPDD